MNPKFLIEKLFHIGLNKNKFRALVHHQQETPFTAAWPLKKPKGLYNRKTCLFSLSQYAISLLNYV